VYRTVEQYTMLTKAKFVKRKSNDRRPVRRKTSERLETLDGTVGAGEPRDEGSEWETDH
jgi:hypothetical protein